MKTPSALVCDCCGRSWGYLEGETLEFAESKEVNLRTLTENQRAVLESKPDGGVFCGKCFNVLATVEGWKKQSGFELAMARLGRELES